MIIEFSKTPITADEMMKSRCYEQRERGISIDDVVVVFQAGNKIKVVARKAHQVLGDNKSGNFIISEGMVGEVIEAKKTRENDMGKTVNWIEAQWHYGAVADAYDLETWYSDNIDRSTLYDIDGNNVFDFDGDWGEHFDFEIIKPMDGTDKKIQPDLPIG